MDYKDKIRKLLALAESPNEHEAKAALLKARQLMAEHKLSENDVKCKTLEIVEKKIEDFTFTYNRNSWMNDLMSTIEQFYPVCCFTSHKRGTRTYYCVVSGFEDDVMICNELLCYAVDCIFSLSKHINRKYDFNGKKARIASNSIGYGFVAGFDAELKKQQEDNPEWGLVLSAPKEAIDKVSAMEAMNVKSTEQLESELDRTLLAVGYAEGTKFGSQKRVKEGAMQ